MKKDLIKLSKYLNDNNLVSEANHLDFIMKKYSFDLGDMYTALPEYLTKATKEVRDAIISPFKIMLDELSTLCLSISAASNEGKSILQEVEDFIESLNKLISFALSADEFLKKYNIIQIGAEEDLKEARERVRLLTIKMSEEDPETGEWSYNFDSVNSELCEKIRQSADLLLSITDLEAWAETSRGIIKSLIKDLESIIK